MKRYKKVMLIIFFSIVTLLIFREKVDAAGSTSITKAVNDTIAGENIYYINLYDEEGDSHLVFCIDHGHSCTNSYKYYNVSGDNERTLKSEGKENEEVLISKVINSSLSEYNHLETQSENGKKIPAVDVIKQKIIWGIRSGEYIELFDKTCRDTLNKINIGFSDEHNDPGGGNFGEGGEDKEAKDYVKKYYENGEISENVYKLINYMYVVCGENATMISCVANLVNIIDAPKSDLYYYMCDIDEAQRLVTTNYFNLPKKVIPKARYFLNDDSDPVYIITGDEISVNETKDFRYDDKDSYVSQGDYDKLMSAYYSGAEEKEANSSNNYTVDFYFKLYLIEVHHYLNVLDSNENPTWSECTNEPDYIYLLVGDDEKSDTLVGDYYDFKKYIENHESESGDLEKLTVSFDGSYYSVRLNEHKSSSEVLEINIDYEPRSFIFNSSKLL